MFWKKLENSIKRHNRLPVSYKIKKKHVKYTIKKLKENEQITMSELQCHLLEKSNKATQSKFTRLETGKLC